jgi:hypothetical protein
MAVAASAAPTSTCAASSVPCQSMPMEAQADAALRFLCGGQTPSSAADLAQRLQAAVPEVYED